MAAIASSRMADLSKLLVMGFLLEALALLLAVSIIKGFGDASSDF